jgi:hypothetical protein
MRLIDGHKRVVIQAWDETRHRRESRDNPGAYGETDGQMTVVYIRVREVWHSVF